MTSFLIISEEKIKAEEKAGLLCDEWKIDAFDRTIFDLRLIESKTIKKSWGISDIKELQKTLLLKPFKSKNKAVILHEADLLTPEAQNALLKVLEEPPDHTYILLTGTSKEAFLPTILSRCSLMQLEREKKREEGEKEEIKKHMREFHNAPIGERLKKAEILSKDREGALEWIQLATISLRDELLVAASSDVTQVTQSLRELQKAHRTISSTNANLRLTLEQLFLSL